LKEGATVRKKNKVERYFSQDLRRHDQAMKYPERDSNAKRASKSTHVCSRRVIIKESRSGSRGSSRGSLLARPSKWYARNLQYFCYFRLPSDKCAESREKLLQYTIPYSW